LLDVLSAPATQELELSHVQTEHSMLEAVRKAVSGLDPRERYVVEQRLMADSGEALSLAEIGRRLGVSRERARQLEQRAKLKLRKRIPACGNSLFNEWLRDLAVPGALAKPAA
jgi:RNA polymerase sigma-32 factor